jgi:hypothetical protein
MAGIFLATFLACLPLFAQTGPAPSPMDLDLEPPSDASVAGSTVTVPMPEAGLEAPLYTFSEVFIIELERLEKKHGYKLSPELHQRIKDPDGLYRSGTIGEASRIIKAKGIHPEERIYELDAYMRSREGEWTFGAVT